MATAAPAPRRGETFNERSKGKDVRTSNIIAAKVCRVSYTVVIIFFFFFFFSRGVEQGNWRDPM